MARPSSDNTPPHRRPPPNYFSRRVQLRLLVLVGAFMLVIVAMDEARKPKYYRWMWGPDRGSDATEPDEVVEDADAIDTRIPEPSPPDNAGLEDALEMANANRYAEDALRRAAEKKNDPMSRASIDAWGQMLSELSTQQRTALNRALIWGRRKQRLDDASRSTYQEAIATLRDALDRYVADARGSLKDQPLLSEQEVAAWHAVLDRLDLAWERKWEPALLARLELPVLAEEHDVTLAELQGFIDELDLAAVVDNAVARPAERNAWFRAFERLQDTDPAELRRSSLGVVGFLQLFKQPDDYRGQVVTIRGQARLGYRVRARKNQLGIEEYHLLWIKPHGTSNAIIVAHCLESTGLPELKHRDKDRGVTELDHEVEITGYFFKKWAYRAEDGIRTAPQLLARAPQVEPTIVWSDVNQNPTANTLLLTTLAAAFGGVLVALAFYYVNQWPSWIHRPAQDAAESLQKIDPSQVSSGVARELRNLEKQMRDETGGAPD